LSTAAEIPAAETPSAGIPAAAEISAAVEFPIAELSSTGIPASAGEILASVLMAPEIPAATSRSTVACSSSSCGKT